MLFPTPGQRSELLELVVFSDLLSFHRLLLFEGWKPSGTFLSGRQKGTLMGLSVGGFWGNPLDEWVHPVSFSSWPQTHSVRKPGSCTGWELGWAPVWVWGSKCECWGLSVTVGLGGGGAGVGYSLLVVGEAPPRVFPVFSFRVWGLLASRGSPSSRFFTHTHTHTHTHIHTHTHHGNLHCKCSFWSLNEGMMEPPWRIT